jgi:hypothetical protein
MDFSPFKGANDLKISALEFVVRNFGPVKSTQGVSLTFSSSPTLRQRKLVLAPSKFFRGALPTREHLSGAPFALTLFANVELGWKGLPATLAYFTSLFFANVCSSIFLWLFYLRVGLRPFCEHTNFITLSCVSQVRLKCHDNVTKFIAIIVLNYVTPEVANELELSLFNYSISASWSLLLNEPHSIG